ncbi:cytochrome b2, mitochondrial precursor [Suhomyces tanzawaensis NRRL Y-17324]|uniref:L-lactate dehydrogenase (cytochrome) n=1 Tax=Suhomyces tanzawaensis NRRL Y-17324 TaxID=984487 RepID=A0A1E4SEB2_9ASCO|nr:cytochrome b2, mitochondrial precursor [Suhomyces tanzawaensis NRRL Y-17324]ODV77823.1 cytochrome b2, mitochondrial precursor [Suhomyces tanzawaensis NRRL Y-17324]
MLDFEEVQKHNTKDDCWVVIHGKAYDVSKFIDEHPGGSAIILKYAGKDATKVFDPVHPPDTLEKYLGKEFHLGEVKMPEKTPKKEYDDDPDEPPSQEELQRRLNIANMPDLAQIYNLNDFEFVARYTMNKIAWAYYLSGCDDEITLRENHLAFHRVFFKPKVLVDVTNVDLRTKMLGTEVELPFYITATALGKLGHPEGERVLARSAGKQGVIQMIPTLASCLFDEIVDESLPDQTQWFQLYVNKDRKVCREIVEHAERRGMKGLFITVDAPQLGRREKDMRSKNFEDLSHVQGDDEEADRSQGAARAILSFIDTALQWSDLEWFRSITKMPLVLKGVQRIDDALKADEMGIDGIVLSNHGGRQLEFSPPPLELLIELMPILKKRGLKMEVYLDGGVRRATDVLKALCLGAKGVGIGRPFLYAMSTYGDEGVYKAIQVLRDEMIMCMRLMGATKISDLDESMIDVRRREVVEDKLFGKVYEELESPAFKLKL